MISVINTIQLPKPITREAAVAIFLSTAARYQQVPGLIRKSYVLSSDGATLGGLYLWQTREDAEALYTDEWKAFVQEKYGAAPSLTFFESPVIVDNVTNEVITTQPLSHARGR